MIIMMLVAVLIVIMTAAMMISHDGDGGGGGGGGGGNSSGWIGDSDSDGSERLTCPSVFQACPSGNIDSGVWYACSR